MSPSTTSSPTSTTSPQALAPASSSSTNKTLAPPPNPMQTPSIFTNKEWIVPPRPKPGRKPAADTPPTKRKAQNRAAQRAFRERRAARVGELEEQMQQMEEEDAKERESLHARINQLEADVDRCSQLVVSWSTKYQRLEDELSSERRLRVEAERRANLDRGVSFGVDDVVPLRLRNPDYGTTSASSTLQTSNKAAVAQQGDTSIGCGNCSIGSRCECIEQAFEIGDIANDPPESSFKRAHSPASEVDSKKIRQSSAADVKSNEEEREIDFTEQFSIRRPPPSTAASTNTQTATTAPDPCGFCQDGTACICAEMAAEERQSKSNVDCSVPRRLSKPAGYPKDPCINGPGSCEQCRSDANSTLFCKSLAATRNQKGNQPPAVQSSGASLPQLSPTSQPPGQQAITGVSLSCADAYATLSRHPAYERASEDPGAWLPNLAAIPGGVERTAFEVEAASVMQTLRFFDRRFGRDG